MNNQSPIVIWRFSDGQPGHDSQSLGLAAALHKLVPVEIHDYVVAATGFNFLNLLLKRFPNNKKKPAPDILIGAGHSTHWPMLTARRAVGGRIIVLMKPSLPVRWFDVVIAPRHDNPAAAENIFLSEGVLNTISPGGQHQPDLGLIMLGGISDEYNWQSTSVVDQIKLLISRRPDMHWTVTSSRRTPAAIMERISRLENVQAMPHTLCQPGWLDDQLALCGEIWVTEDSVSMLYEALSSGARVGLIKVQRAKQGRVATGVDTLVKEGCIPEPGSFQLTKSDVKPLQEALRCAQWVQQRWLKR